MQVALSKPFAGTALNASPVPQRQASKAKRPVIVAQATATALNTKRSAEVGAQRENPPHTLSLKLGAFAMKSCWMVHT